MFLWFQWRFHTMRHVSFAIQEWLFENPEWGIKEWNGEWNEESVKPGIVKAGICKTR